VVWQRSHRTTCDGPVHDYAIRREESLEQIQFLLGHVSIQTTERYLGCKQRFRDAVNDHIGLEKDPPS
jgi:integrase